MTLKQELAYWHEVVAPEKETVSHYIDRPIYKIIKKTQFNPKNQWTEKHRFSKKYGGAKGFGEGIAKQCKLFG